jgi:hypothetical protein
MTLAEKFDDATRGKGMPVVGVAVLGNSVVKFQHVVERADGVRVRIDFAEGATAEQMNAAVRAVEDLQL